MKPSPYPLRRLTPADAEAAYALRLHALADAPHAFGMAVSDAEARGLDGMRQTLRDHQGDSALFGACCAGDDARLVAMAGLWRADRAKTRHRASLWGMFVHADHRGHGLGRALVEAIVDHAANATDLSAVTLAVTTVNTPAFHLYIALGFRPYGLDPDALRIDGASYDEVLMSWDADAARRRRSRP